MNRSELIPLLNTLKVSAKIDSDDCNIEFVTSNLQEATKNSIAFYRFKDLSQTTVELFNKRLSTKPSLLITNENISSFYAGDFITIKNENFYGAQSLLAKKFYPIENVVINSVTGTNGKTSVAFLAMQIANILERDALYVGTLGLWKNGKCLIEEINNTTPSLLEFSRMVHDNKTENMIVFMEVSSHALDQNRVNGLTFSSAAWTNLTQDHLDYHKTMENYFLAKLKIANYMREGAKLFFPENQKELLQKVLNSIGNQKIKCEFADAKPESFIEIPENFKIGFNKTNLDLAISLNRENVNKSKKYSLKGIVPPPGRFASYEFKNNIVVVDYAHTPDALENILKELKHLYGNQKQIITIFGCGGDRDRSKRPIMGNIAKNFSDKVVVTSDNPRTEDPMSIIDEIVQSDTFFKINENRKEAIATELSSANNAVILIAGKGHEPYQEINGVKHLYSDIELVKEIIHDI